LIKYFCISLFLTLTNLIFPQVDSFISGVDLSFTPQIEALGGRFTVNGINKESLDIFRENGANYIRLRIWHTPADGYCSLESTIAFAKRAKAKGYKFLLDFHYSDWWADPAKQNKPAAWANFPFENLKDSIYAYSKFVITTLKYNGVMPDMVQPGNEITNGMLWPDGKNDSPEGWNRFLDLLQKGIQGIKDGAGSFPVKIMLHIDTGADYNKSVLWLNNIIDKSILFDVIGLTYYPWWQGTLEALRFNINALAARYDKDIIIVETAYPWTLSWKDNWNNTVGPDSPLLAGYPASVQGQIDFMNSLKNIIRNTSGSKGIGFFYWAPDWISLNNSGSAWENLTFFDFNGNALNSISAFNNSPSGVTKNTIPFSFRLEQNYPNPFNPSTVIKYAIPPDEEVHGAPVYVSIMVYDVLGRKISTLVNETKQAGTHSVFFNGANLPGGVYFYTLHAGDYNITKKMMLVK